MSTDTEAPPYHRRPPAHARPTARHLGGARPQEGAQLNQSTEHRPSNATDDAAAVQRVHALRTLCDRLGVDQPPRAYGLPAIDPDPTPNLFDHQEVAR